MADTDIKQFLPVFAGIGTPVAFLVPTPTGYGKSLMDATSPVRQLLKDEGIHNYELQGQGPENKKMIPSYFVYSNSRVRTLASLYRPVTKHGDPRIWFKDLRSYCNPRNLLAIIVCNNEIYVINLSNPDIQAALMPHGYVFRLLQTAVQQKNSVANELLHKLQLIHNKGFMPSITPGDPGVGDTLENALGISRNNSKLPDYNGIELKASRTSRGGKQTGKTRVNLFSKVPDNGLSYSQIVAKYGRETFSAKANEYRFSLENTTFASRRNSYGLILDVQENTDKLNLCYQDDNGINHPFSSWDISGLRKTLLVKHHETFWVQAESIERGGREWFRYNKIIHTKSPNDSLLAPLLASDTITVDLAGYYRMDREHGNLLKWRDHGILFKIWPNDRKLLFGSEAEYDLTK